MSEREIMEYDVIVVGAGPAGLACAMRLKQLDGDLAVCVIEKAAEIGGHILSGAVIEPEPLDALVEDWRDDPPPICIAAGNDELAYLTKTGKRKLPTPPQQKNHGNFIVSLGALCAWLAPKAEELGVDLFPGFAAADLNYDDNGAVQGVIIGDMGVDRDGNPKDSYVQGIEIRAPVTVLAEGCRGSLTKRAIAKYRLDAEADPQTYGIGMKELWKLPEGRVRPGFIQHTVGWPLPKEVYGGSFVYHLDRDRLAVGFVCGLDYGDPEFSPFEAFQQFKHHPAMHELLEGGEILAAGARALAEGGFQSLPKVEMPGAVLIGDSAGLLNVPKIKGVHQALKSGMLAAGHIAEHKSSEGFDARLRDSDVVAELKKVRNIRPAFRKGLWRGMATAAIETITAGKLKRTLSNHADHEQYRKLDHGHSGDHRLEVDYVERDLPPRDRTASVYFASTAHDEDQPVHLKIVEPDVCFSRCEQEYGNPCTRFCPAAVYEKVEDENGKRIQINAANCVHCKTCDIADPYQVINWVTPEGGSGPNYSNL
ncbi:MAG: electron transfer flavoprotein-ubiquinone oxidoreductase [Wenzhouxiangellaceae bacterium]|nr:electron transfer flavoprotein-ubiquinone oxidoreductase [Wenzhouxiangellaceae bacterium]